jgi:cephalosporin hydroxylase
MNVVDRAVKIPGWMSLPELIWLNGAAAGRRLVIEFGAWCGRSTVAMTSAASILSVDTWQGSPEHQSCIADGFDPLTSWLLHTADYGHVQHSVCDLSSQPDVDELVHRYAGGASMVFVDANHSEESVARDIETARRLLCPGGLLCGHDFGSEYWPGVEAAVTRLVASVQRGPHSIWFEGGS